MEKSRLIRYFRTITEKTVWKDAAAFCTRKSLKSQASVETDYSIYRLTKRDYLREGATGAAISAMVSYTFYKSAVLFLLLLPAALIAFPLSQRIRLKNKRLWELTVQFKEAIWIVSGFLSAGMSVENAFMMSVPELVKLYQKDAMIVLEFQRIARGISVNKSIETMLFDFAKRSGLSDIRNFAEVFAIAKRNGGSLKDIIERTGKIIRDKTTVSEEIKNMTASRRYEQNIMNVLPFGIILYINLTTKGFLNVMYETLTGRLIMTVCLVLVGVSYYISQRILDIKV